MRFKRREFLQASLGLAGLTLSDLEAAESRPCPPGSARISGGSSAADACGQAAAVGAPPWFEQMADQTWIAFDSGPVKDISEQPIYEGLLPTDRPRGIFSYSSGCVHGARQSLLLYGGGHGAGGDNGIYELSLVDDDSQGGAPRWKAFKVRGKPLWPEYYATAPSTDAVRYDDPAYEWDQWSDGTPVDSHTYQNFVWDPVTDSVWHLYQSGMFTAGASSNAPSWWGTPARETVWKIDTATRTWTRVARTDRAAANSYRSQWPGNGPTIFVPDGMNARVPRAHVIRLLAGTQSHSYHYMVDVRTGARFRPSPLPARIGSMEWRSTAATAYEHGVILWCSIASKKMHLIDMSDYTLAKNAVAVTVENWPPGDWSYHGLVWHAGSKALLAWGERTSAFPRSSLWRLSPPSGNWWTGPWKWSEVPAMEGGAIPDVPFVSATYGRFNIVNNLGGSGRDALILVNAEQGPTYVYKLPKAGFA